LYYASGAEGSSGTMLTENTLDLLEAVS
jgi:hypothetical protein